MFNEFYRCDNCSSIFELLKGVGNNLCCCDRLVKKITPNSVDADHEKHVPVIEHKNQGVLVKVGSEPHPMIDVHYIEWIEIRYGSRSERKHLRPGSKPEASFRTDSKDVSALAFCNLHGLWVSKRNSSQGS